MESEALEHNMDLKNMDDKMKSLGAISGPNLLASAEVLKIVMDESINGGSPIKITRRSFQRATSLRKTALKHYQRKGGVSSWRERAFLRTLSVLCDVLLSMEEELLEQRRGDADEVNERPV
jgi:hypothetical protein